MSEEHESHKHNDESKNEESESHKHHETHIKEHNSDEHVITERFIAKGTTCESCAEIIKRQAMKVEGVKEIHYDYKTEKGKVTFDSNKTDLDTILYKIEEKGYTCYILEGKDEKKSTSNVLGWTFAIVGIVIAAYFLFGFVEKIQLPQISQNMGYGLLFVVGLLTGFHCVAMCGGFVVSYTAKDAQEGRKSHVSHLLYGAGKTISYTVIGAIFGLIGSIIAFTPLMRGVAGIIAGVFLVLFGLKMLNIFPILRYVSIKAPKFISKFVGEKHGSAGPFGIGLLNGLMIACGPLQAIYIMAAGTGSMIEGAKLLFVFALGTLPVMLGFGYFASFISNKMTHKILKASGVIVIILGLFMLNNGLTLTGSGYDIGSIANSVNPTNNLPAAPSTGSGQLPNNVAVLKDGYQEIHMDVLASGWSPNTFVLKKGVPVRWIINGKEITGCNSAIQVPSLNLEFKIKQGEQTINFTPTQSGNIPWSCWMGMIKGTFIVKDDISDTASIQKDVAAVGNAVKSSGGCGCGGGAK